MRRNRRERYRGECFRVDYILGSVGILSANSMLGELTPRMAAAIAESPAQKILIPLNRCNLFIVGIRDEPLIKHRGSS